MKRQVKQAAVSGGQLKKSSQKALLTAVIERSASYTTSLFGVTHKGRIEPCASATFVRHNGEPCLLTASHVWERIEKYRTLLMTTGGEKTVKADCNTLVCLKELRPVGRIGQWGPDLALIRLPTPTVSNLTAHGKAFYNLDTRKTAMLSTKANPKSGMWVCVGTPGENVDVRPTDATGKTGITFDLVVSSTIKPRIRLKHDLDYVGLSLRKVRVVQNGRASRKKVKLYKGFSGASLWRLGQHEKDGKLHWTVDGPMSLEGVAFWQRGAKPPKMLRCLGRVSVYKHLLRQRRRKVTLN